MDRFDEGCLITYANEVNSIRGVDETSVRTVLRVWAADGPEAAIYFLRIVDEEAQQGKEVTK